LLVVVAEEEEEEEEEEEDNDGETFDSQLLDRVQERSSDESAGACT
jgi:hypothetical protein